MKKIAIIGAGISGLYIANLLEKENDFKYKIFEKRSKLDLVEGYGIQLSVNCIKLLNKIGFKNISASDIFFPTKVNFFKSNNPPNPPNSPEVPFIDVALVIWEISEISLLPLSISTPESLYVIMLLGFFTI